MNPNMSFKSNEVTQPPSPAHDHFPPHNNFNENIVTTSVFIVMVLIFIGVLLIACCKVLIGCTARNLFSSNSRRNNANMIYAINNNILGGGGEGNENGRR